jgi:hypothetical protein
MRLFDTKNEGGEIIELIKEAQQDFKFDQENVKAKLMMAVTKLKISVHEKPRLTFSRYALGLGSALVIFLATTALAMASNASKPGEFLFPVQKFENKAILSLPLPATKKAEISTRIVAKRLKELDEIDPTKVKDSAQLGAEVKAAQESIQRAAKYLPAKPSSDQSSKKTQKIDNIIDQLNDLTTKHQEKLESIKQHVSDEKIKAEIDQSVANIKLSKEKWLQAKSSDKSDDQNKSDSDQK